MTLQNLAHAAAWLMLAAIVVLSLVPPMVRPTTELPHGLEHLSIFLLNGLAFGVAYPGRERWLGIGAVAFCAGIELAQLMVPGRHARVSDFVVDVIGAGIGIFAAPLLVRVRGRPAQRSQT
jgi:VanZ family protein